MKRLIWIVAGLLFALTSCGEQDLELRLQPDTGSQYRGKMNLDSSFIRQGEGTGSPVTQHLAAGIVLEVTGRQGDNTELEVRYDYFDVRIETEGISLSYNTRSGAGNSELAVLSDLINRSFVLVVDPKGKVLDVKRVNILLNSLLKKKEIDERAALLLLEILEEGKVKESFKSMFHFLPEKTVRRGESWERIELYKQQESLSFRSVDTWTLNGLTEDRVTLKFSGKIEGTDASVQLGGSQRGSYTLERKTGMPLDGHVEQNMEGTLLLSGQNGNPVKIESSVGFSFQKND